MVLVVVFGELDESVGVFGGEDEGLGVDAGFEGVQGGGGLAKDRGRAGGFLGVTAIGFYLTVRRHSGSVWGQKLISAAGLAAGWQAKACPTLKIAEGVGGFGGAGRVRC